eukprot:jgi/Chrzof1/3887/Cz13g12060.t1
MSARLVKKQLSAIQQEREQQASGPQQSKIPKKKRIKHRKQAAQQLQKQTADPSTTYQKNLEYCKATKAIQSDTAELMNRLLGMTATANSIGSEDLRN